MTLAQWNSKLECNNIKWSLNVCVKYDSSYEEFQGFGLLLGQKKKKKQYEEALVNW